MSNNTLISHLPNGFDDAYAHFQAALKLGILVKKGSWYRLADVDESFHEADFGDILQENSGLREKIAIAARQTFWSKTVRSRFLDEDKHHDNA